MELIKNNSNQMKSQNTYPRKPRKISKNQKKTKKIKKNLNKMKRIKKNPRIMRNQRKKITKNQRTQNTP